MIGTLHHGLRDQRRSAHAFNLGYAARPFLRSVHTTRVELNDAFCIWQSAIADAVVERIELDDIDAGNQRVENVRAADHLLKGSFDAGHSSAVLEFIPIGGGDDRWLDRSDDYSGGLAKSCFRK